MPTPPNKQNINIGIQSNDGTGDSIRDAFRKTNENFEVLFDYIGAGDGLRFTNLEDYGDTYKSDPDQTKRLGPGNQLVSTVVDAANTNGGVILVMRDVVAGLGMRVEFSENNLTIINSTSTLSTDFNPILGGDLKGTGQGYRDIAIGTGTETTSTFGTYAWRGTDFADPIADQDLVTRQYLYDKFINRDGITLSGTETTTATVIGGSIFRENVSVIPNGVFTATSSTNIGKYITIINSSGTTSTVDLTLQATSSTHITRKDYVDTKISLQGVDTIDPATGEVNPGFGKMTGPLILSRDPQTSDDFDYNGFIAATKQYVDKNDFFSDNNLFVTAKGRDYQPDVPPVRRGRSPAYAFASLNKAAIYAEQLIATSRIEVGDYARLITYSNGTAATVVDTTANYYGDNLARLRLEVGSFGSDQFGAADVGQYTIFPGQYIEGVTSKAIALIENISKGDNPGDPEIYSIAYVDYADDFNTDIVTSVPDFANTQRVKLTFSNAPQQIVPIPDFWIGYQFYTDTGIQNGTIVEIGSDVDNAGIYQNYFIVEWTSGAPGASQTIPAADWHVYAGDFSPNETVVYNTNVSALQVTFVIESGEYYEQYPIKLSANTSIRGDEFRRVIIRPAPGVSSSRWANTYFRRDAQVDGLQATALDYDTDYAQGGTLVSAVAIPSGSSGVISVTISTGSFPTEYVGYMFVANGGQGIIDDATTGGFTVNLGTEMLNAAEIPYGEWHIYKPIVFGYHYLRDPKRPMNLLVTQNNPGGLENAASLITANRTFIQEETIKYLDITFVPGGFVYDSAKCKRDVGLFVDSFTHDLIYGGSEKSVYAGDIYKSVALVQAEELIQTAAAVQFIGTLSQQIITNTPIQKLSTEVQYINSATVAEATAGVILADLVQATARIILNDADYNPPKENDQLDVFLMNDANVIRYVSCQNHGGFMQVLDPVGQVRNKSPYTQTASSFSQSVNKQAFRGGMLVDGFTGNVEATPVDWDTVNSPLSLDVTGLSRRPQVPTFFMNKGVRYEVSFFANFRQDGVDANNVPLYAATLRLNPLSPGGIPNAVDILDTVGGFKASQTNIPIIIEQPTGIGGLGATGHAETDSTGYITAVVIDFPGTGYTSTPFLNIGGAILNNLTIVAGGITNATLVTGGYGYAVGCKIEIIPVGIIGGVSAKGAVTAVDGNGTILAFTISTPGSGWNGSVNYRVAFGGVSIIVPTPAAGFLDTVPSSIELVTAGNRSMLANDFTQVNDLGYGIFVTNGGFMENVSMFTYYCYRSYYALNGSQVRTLTGSSVYGEYGLVADGKDPTEVPLALNNVFPMVQLATAYVNNPLFPAQVGQTYIYVTINSLTGGYPPLNGSIIEINHGGVRQNYSVGSASPALNSSNELIPNTYQLFFNTGNISVGTSGLGLLTAVSNGDPIIIRASTLVKVSGFNPVSIARPSTTLTWDDNPTYVYNITGFSTVQPDGSVFAYTQQDYNYITFQAVDQGVVRPTLINGGTGYSSTNTVVNISGAGLVSGTTQTTNGDQGGGTIGIQTLVMNNVAGIVVGQKVTTSTYILTDTFVTYVNATTKQICLSNPTNGYVPDGTSLSFTASVPLATATINSGTITGIVIQDGGAGWTTPSTAISIVGTGVGAGVASPVTVAGVAGSSIVKITTLDLTSQNRIRQGLVASPQQLYQFAHGGTIYQITGYRTPSSKGVVFEVSIVDGAYASVAITADGSGYSLSQPLTILGTQLGGLSPENDLDLLITSVNSSGGVLAVSFTGTSIAGTINYSGVSPPDDGQTSAEIDVTPPLTEAMSKGTILRAGIPIFSGGSLTTKISILRATGHDFVDIGTGGYASTRIPNDLYGPPLKARNPSHEVIQANRGRVYYVTSDQDGNFRVGDALTVNQAQGSVTISVPLDLSNLSSLSLRRDLGPPVNEFSIDSTMVTEADYKVPTEQAVANYVNRRLGLDRNGNIYAGSPLGPQFLALDGQLAMKADLDMGYTHRIIHLQTPAVSTDAATKGYTDTKIANAGTAATDVNGVTLLPDWGRMTGSLQLYNDPIIKTATVATTATLGATSITFEDLTALGEGGYQPGDFFYSRINGIGIPEGTIITTVFQDNVTLGLGNPITENNVGVTQVIPKGTVFTFDPVKQAATKRYVDIQNQFSKLNDVTLTNTADVDLVMFNSTVLPVSTSTNPPLYESARQVVNVANDTNTISNTPSSRAGGSDITIERPTANTIRIKLVGGAGALNPITDYHINDNAQIQQAKLLMTTATTSVSAPTGGQRPQQASLGVAQFTSLSFKATNGWIELKDATAVADGVQTNKMAWIPTGGGLLGATNTAANTSATYVTSATVKTWLGNESTAWNFSSDLIPRTDNQYNVGNGTFRWRNIVANTGTFDGGLILNTNARISTDQAIANVFTTTANTLNLGPAAGTLATIGYATVVGTQATQAVFNTVATTVNAFGAATTLTLGNATAATATLRPGTLVGSNTTQAVFDTVATTVNAFGSATTLTLGNATGATATLRPGTLVGSNTTQNVFNTVATTVNAFGAATAIRMGGTGAVTTITGNLDVSGAITDSGNRVITSVDWSSGSGISITSETTTGPSASATINNTGVLSMAASNNLSVDVSTGNVTVTSNATSANTANTIVSRNASGNFSAGTITATLSGTSTGFPAGTVAEIGRYLDFHTDAGAQFDYDVRFDAQAGASAGTGLLIMSGTGGFYCTGNITANYSDDRLKTKLGKIENALDKICSLEGFYYEPNQTAQDLGYLVKREVGVSAQSTQASMPEIVVPAPIDDQYLTVQYDKFAPFIIEAIKELRAEVEAIKKALK